MSNSSASGNVPFVDMRVVNAPYVDELRAAFERVLASSQFVGGQEVTDFEALLATHSATSHATGTNTGTSALHIALQAAGIGPGDEVILPANTFFATAEAVVAVGANPVLVDCHMETALMDADATESAITDHTAAIIPVHLYGQPVDADRFRAIAERHSLFFLEDNAQAIGATWNGRPTGSLGDAAAFSFYPAKNLGALGEGGAITTSDDELARKARLLVNHGSARKYDHEEWGWNERIHVLQAAFLAVKLPRLSAAQASRDAAVARYRELLGDRENITWFETQDKATHVHHLLVVRVPQRDDVLGRMEQAGIGASIHYPVPLHLTPAAGDELGVQGDFPNAEALASSIISLPLFAGITDQQVERVAKTLVESVLNGPAL